MLLMISDREIKFLRSKFMNRLFSFLIASVCLFSCEIQENKPAAANISVEKLDSLVNAWHGDAASGSFADYFAFTHEQFVFLGTDSTERWSKDEFKAFCKPHFEDGKGWDFQVVSRNWMANKDSSVWWFDEQLDTWMKDCRGSGVILIENQEAKIAHYNLSVTIENDLVNRYISLKDSIHGREN